MIEDYIKLMALATVYSLVPPIVGKKLLYEMLNMADFKLNKEELSALEKHFKEQIEPRQRMMNVNEVIFFIDKLHKTSKNNPDSLDFSFRQLKNHLQERLEN